MTRQPKHLTIRFCRTRRRPPAINLNSSSRRAARKGRLLRVTNNPFDHETRGLSLLWRPATSPAK